MNEDYLLGTAVGLVILVAAIPFVARIRHPDQKPLAAYLIFMTVFGASVLVLFALVVSLARALRQDTAIFTGPGLVLVLVLVCVPAVGLATWQARRPPWRRGPPN